MNPETPNTTPSTQLPSAPGPIGNGPQKRRRALLIFVSILALLVIIGGSVAAYYLLKPTPQAEEQKLAGDPEDRVYVSPRKDVDSSTDYDKNDKAVKFGHFEVTLNSVTNNYQLKDDPTPEGYTFMLVNISAKNTDSSAHLLSDTDINILVGDDTIISPLITRTVAPALIPKSVEPDDTSTGNLLYQVPKDATGLKLYYKTEIFNEKTQKLEKLEYTMSL